MRNHVVWKYAIPLVDEFKLDLPLDCCIFTVHSQGDQGCMWIQCDSKAKTETRHFINVGTGDEKIDRSWMRYIGTYFLNNFVWHIYEDVSRGKHESL